MKGKKQKRSQDTCQQKNRTESEGYVEGQTFIWITENNTTKIEQKGYGLLEKILSPANLNAAYRKVKSNKGSRGVDKMEVESLKDYLIWHKDDLIASILSGKFQPNPVKRVEIDKENGKKRQLGIPTVVDRVIQQAILQVLSPIYEKEFSSNSYGFRPGRNAHQALLYCKEQYTAGYEFAVDIDLERFFDTVNHSRLIQILSGKIKDGRVVSLIHKYLNAGVVIGGRFEKTAEGVPQGGPLSPLLGNIMLHELDKELERRGYKFARYADDMLILSKSKRGAERSLASISKFIEGKLYLKVNKEKSCVACLREVKFLGYSFYKSKNEGRLRVHQRSVEKLKTRIRELTSRSNGWSNERRKAALKQYITGWVNYFKLADMKSLLMRIDEWYRRRIRMVIWKQWKRIKTKYENLIKLGVTKSKAFEWCNTRKGYWHIAGSFILNTTVTTDRLRRSGYVFLTDYYQKVQN